MDYEKKYNEALERARKVHRNYKNLFPEDSYSEDIEEIFPELRESEDERIRKGLIKLLTVASEAYLVESTGIKKDSYLAYLEKQKWQKPDVDESTKRLNENWMKQYFDEQQEQKPAEWSEEDEKMLTDISWAIRHCAYDDKKKERVMKWFNDDYRKSLRPSWKPSEEQMEAFRGYLEDFQAKAEAAVGGWNNFDVMIRLYEQLKKL